MKYPQPEEKMPEKYLALDIGNVCLEIHPERCFGALGYASLADVPPELLHFESEIYERGQADDETFFRKFRELIGAKFSEEELRDAFSAIVCTPLPGMPELVASLPARGILPVFFSDTSTLHLAEVFRKFPAVGAVAGGIYSCEVGAKKPEPAMFEAFERRFARPVLYVDDRPDLIEGARAYGWNAVRFTGAPDLEKKLFN